MGMKNLYVLLALVLASTGFTTFMGGCSSTSVSESNSAELAFNSAVEF